jgi:hypothetical protein
VQLIVKYFFLAGILFLGVVLDLVKYIFPWLTCFIWGWEASWIRAVLQSDAYGICAYTFTQIVGVNKMLYVYFQLVMEGLW